MNFDQSFERLIGHEGGYVNNPADPGGETKYGVSKRSYPHEDIEHLTLERAKTIYLRDFWTPAGCDVVPDGVKFDLFDMAVNSGVKQALKTLQKAIAEEPDGVLGPKTLQAINSMPATRLMARFNGYRLDFMTQLKNWDNASRGWARRIASNLMQA